MADITKMTENEEMESVEAGEVVTVEEMEQARKSGVVDFSGKKEEKEKSGNYTHTFKNPVEIEGKKYAKLTFYFESLTGMDVEAIEEELQDQNKYILTPETSSTFQSMLAARAAKIPADAIKQLPLRDYMAIKNRARNFLINMG